MKKNDEYNEEEAFRRMFDSSKIKAPENLKYRIMQQIENENVLTRQANQKQSSERKSYGNVLKDLTSIFGTMYAVLAVIVAVAYFLQGKEFLQSPQFWGTIIFVATVFSLLWLISRLDANMREKRLSNQLNKKAKAKKAN